MERATVHVDGVVQSVGFRPFVYRRAVAHDLGGTVRNLGDAGVRIELEGDADAIDAFLADLRADPPPLARIYSVDVEREPASEAAFGTMRILESAAGGDGGGTIPPDTATCERCLADIHSSDSRYHDYWATSCLDCGPRFTVIEALPYDRPTTSMAAFPMCEACRREYEDPADRRYHAQTIACPTCGPTLTYGTAPAGTETEMTADEPVGRDPVPGVFTVEATGRPAITAAATAIADGGIVVVKGLGGAHLACDATSAAAVEQLRERTGRPTKPFALLVPDVETVAEIAAVSGTERETLASPRRPLLLLEQTGDADIADAVAPGLHTVGVMLPYTGIHYLLFEHLSRPLVMTSANLPGRPMLTANAPLVGELGDVADGFLLHDRRIVARCDDSLGRVVDGERRLIRRSRGFAPTPVPLEAAEGDARILGVGPELDVAACLLDGTDAYLTQYLGDVDDVETFTYFTDAVAHLRDVTGLDGPPVVAHDAHPAFNTTRYAERLADEGAVEEAVAVQHHHAHAASVLAEHDEKRAIALTLDGVGYGPDGTVWGGEVLDATLADYDRVGGLAPVPMPGGDRATRHPGRLAAGLLYAATPEPDAVAGMLERLDVSFPDGDDERDLVCQQLAADVNTPQTSSAGRFLDAVSALLGACSRRRYEGEPAMKLEALAAGGEPRSIDVPRATIDDRPIVDTPALFGDLVELVEDGDAAADVAATAQTALADGLAVIAVAAADDRSCGHVALSGGVAYNEAIAARIRARVERTDLSLLGNDRVPPGDGGIAYGQCAVAAARTHHRP